MYKVHAKKKDEHKRKIRFNTVIKVHDKNMQIFESNHHLRQKLQKKSKLLISPAFWLTLFVLLGGFLRSLSLNKELTDFLYCDEAIYQNEIERIIAQNDFVTGVFLSGGLNFFPVSFILELFTKLEPSANADTRLMIIRFLFPIILSSVTVILIYFLAKSLHLSDQVALVSSLLYSIAAFPVSQSHIYYPDSYSVFFGTLAMYSIVKFMNSTGFNLHFMAFAISLGVSIKYTLICFFLTGILSIVFKQFNRSKSIFELLNLELKFFAMFCFYFAIMNYSIFINPLNFVYDFATNIANYGVNDGSKLNAAFFYLVTMLLIPIGIGGSLLVLYGLTILKNKRNLSKNLIVFGSPILFFLLLTKDANLATVRNINAFLGMIFIFFGFLLVNLVSSKFRFLGLLVLVMVVTQSLYYVAQTTREDSRNKASRWINSNVIKGETIGINPACGYKLLQDNDYQLISDPDMAKGYNVYVFDMYWANSEFYNVYSRNSWFLEFNPKYTMFYHSHNQLPNEMFSFKGFDKSIDTLVPTGYEAKTISGFGPDVIILRKILK